MELFYRFSYPQASEVALLTALFELFRGKVTHPEVTIGVLGSNLVAVRVKSSEISESAVRTAYLDALENAVQADANDCNAVLDLNSQPPHSALDAELLSYLLPPVPVATRLTLSDAIAVKSPGVQYTYAQLLDRAARLATRLKRRGAGPDSTVAMALDRSADLVTAILAIWKTGAAYLPVDPAYPEERRKFLLEDSGAAFTVTGRDFDFLDQETPMAHYPVNPESLAYLTYTSGSSGQPKGVPVTHASFGNFIDSVRWRTGIGPHDRFVAVTTPCFDISAMELMLPLIVGATVIVATRDEALQGRSLAALLKRERATMMFGTPATWRLLLDSGWQGNKKLVALCGGEELSRHLADRLLEKTGAVWNMFGPTEATVASTMVRVKAGADPVPIGRALARTQLHIEDGELWIAGAGVSPGYWKRPELTAERFTEDGYFKTGDLVQFTPEGDLQFLGRVDEQLKVRGFRIEPGEIEAAILSYPGVSQAAVIKDRESLRAFVCPAVDVDNLRRHLAQHLPEHMAPEAIVALAEFPLLPNGKLDRRALLSAKAQPVSFEAPSGLIEKALAEIFEEVLRAPCVSATDNFFHLGGHSLLAGQVLARVWEMWRIEFPARTLFDAPSLRELAKRIAEAQGARGQVAKARPNNLPLSPAQARLWFLHQFHVEERALYNIPAVLRLSGPLDAERLASALNQVVARHESLRSSFGVADGEPVLTIHPEARVELRIVSADQARREAAAPFNLTRAPLLRTLLVPLGAEEWELFLTMHHIVSDGWSMGVLFRELSKLYRGHELAPLSYSYSCYALEQSRVEQAEERHFSYWRSQLSDLPSALELPADRPRGSKATYGGARELFDWPADIGSRISVFCRKNRVTPFITLLSAFAVLLHRYTGETDVIVGTTLANRSRVETEQLIGFFVNTIPLRVKIAPMDSFDDILRRARDSALDGLAHGELPFQSLVEAIQPERSLVHTPFFQVMFSQQNAAQDVLDLPGVTVTETRYDPEWVKLDLTINIEKIAEGVAGSIDYNSGLFERTRIERLAGHLLQIVDAALRDPSCAVSELPLLTPAEREQLASYNATETPPATDFLSAFRRHVAAQPDRPAVECEGSLLTYAELDNLTDGPSDIPASAIVPVIVHRDRELMPQLLLIWKRGSAYVPIDPGYPADRQQFMREDIAGSEAAGDLAYVIYTSGSTGRPKGVCIRRDSIGNLLEAMRVTVPVDERDVMLALASAAFDMSVPELWLPLYCGAKLVLATLEDARDPGRLRLLLERTKATVMQGTPALWAALLDTGWRPPVGFKLLVGAEPLPQAIADRLAELPCTVWNMFGPTETTVWSTMGRVTAEPVSIGRPIANTRVYVLDAHLQSVPSGNPGELYIGGIGVAEGYWRRPELTTERFIRLPNGERVYRTGDQVRFGVNGQLEFIQRLDSQVKLRGYRIELGEIEAALGTHRAVDLAAAAIRDDNLYAWVQGQAVEESELRNHLMRLLPAYMVPNRIVPVDKMPLSANGKLDRKQLTLPDPAAEQRDEFEDPLERQLLPIWREILNVDNLGPHSNFFHHGGHSLSGMRLASRVEKLTGQEFPVQILFRAPTIRSMTQHLRRNAPIALPPGLIDIQARGAQPPIFFCNVRAGCWNLAHALGTDQPLLGVESGRDAVAAVRARLADGPYRIAAYGDGAELAIELATRLGTAEYIAFFDPPALPDVSGPDVTGRIVCFRSTEGPVFESPTVERIAEWMKSA